MSYMTVDMWEEGRRRSFKRSWKTSYLASGAKGKLERALLDDPDGPVILFGVKTKIYQPTEPFISSIVMQDHKTNFF